MRTYIRQLVIAWDEGFEKSKQNFSHLFATRPTNIGDPKRKFRPATVDTVNNFFVTSFHIEINNNTSNRQPRTEFKNQNVEDGEGGAALPVFLINDTAHSASKLVTKMNMIFR